MTRAQVVLMGCGVLSRCVCAAGRVDSLLLQVQAPAIAAYLTTAIGLAFSIARPLRCTVLCVHICCVHVQKACLAAHHVLRVRHSLQRLVRQRRGCRAAQRGT